MLTRLLRVFTGSWGAGVTYGNYKGLDEELTHLSAHATKVESELVFTCTGRFPRKLRSIFSPKRYPSGCGVSNFSPPMKKWLAK